MNGQIVHENALRPDELKKLVESGVIKRAPALPKIAVQPVAETKPVASRKKEKFKGSAWMQRQRHEAAFLRWWHEERKSSIYEHFPYLALAYSESLARKAWMFSAGVKP